MKQLIRHLNRSTSNEIRHGRVKRHLGRIRLESIYSLQINRAIILLILIFLLLPDNINDDLRSRIVCPLDLAFLLTWRENVIDEKKNLDETKADFETKIFFMKCFLNPPATAHSFYV